MSGTRREAAGPTPLRPNRPCPVCKRKSVREFYPFCSKRCADIDLNRWFTGAYAIAGTEAESGDGQDSES